MNEPKIIYMRQPPGSFLHLPATAVLRFTMNWTKRTPGNKSPICLIRFRDQVTAIFPLHEWDVPLDVDIECTIWPYRNVGLAAPVDGIPDDQIRP